MSSSDPAWLAEALAREARGDLMGAIESLTEANRRAPSLDIERRLRAFRHRAFCEQRGAGEAPLELTPAPPVPLDPEVGLPVASGPLTAELVRGAIDVHGSLLVRGLLSVERALQLREAIQATLRAREQRGPGVEASPWYDEFREIQHRGSREFTKGSGALAADSPRGFFLLLEAFRERGIDRVAAEFLGARPAVSVEKSVFRYVEPQAFASWHQDGAFLGERIRSLDVWIALTRCGRVAPGLEIFPRRVDRVLPTGAFFAWDLSEDVLRKEYPGVDPVTPEFDVGDGILFDQLCVHRSAHSSAMTEPRFAIECWLFAPATFPAGYTALLI